MKNVIIKKDKIENDELELVFPTMEYKEKVEEYLQEFFDNGEYELNGDAGLDHIKNYEEWLDKIKKDLNRSTLQDDCVDATVYLTIRKSDKKIVGNIQIRHRLNEKLLKYGGHIGDGVRPSERRKGYATKQIALALQKCKELGIGRVLMDCNKSNIGSAKSIINNGGVLDSEVIIDGEVVQNYWISLKKKFVTNPDNMEILEKGSLKIKNICNKDFCGDIALIKFNKMKEPYIIKDINLCMADENYKWLEFYDYNSKARLTAMYNDKNEIIEWYFDIARLIGKENNLPYEDDLYLDVVVTPDGKTILLDEDELKMAVDRLEVTKEDSDEAYKIAYEIIGKVKNNSNKLKEFTDKYLKIMNMNEN